VEGLTGTSGDPFDAVRQELAEHRYDRVIISTLPRRVSKWLRRDLAKRVEALGSRSRSSRRSGNVPCATASVIRLMDPSDR